MSFHVRLLTLDLLSFRLFVVSFGPSFSLRFCLLGPSFWLFAFCFGLLDLQGGLPFIFAFSPFILAFWAFISCHFCLLTFHFGLLGFHFLSFLPSHRSFPFILAFWAFISLHFGLLGLHFLSFWPFGPHFLAFWPFGASFWLFAFDLVF